MHHCKALDPKIILHRGGGGAWNLQFLVSSTYTCYMPNLVKIDSEIRENKMLTDEDGRQSIPIVIQVNWKS